MKVNKVNHVYIEDNHGIQSKRLEKHLYAQAIESLIVVCADILIINKKKKLIYLAERSVKPMKGFWSIGGRRFVGDTLVESVRNNFLRETSVNINMEKFEYICTKEVIWKDRKEEPQDFGKHDLVQFFYVELDFEELKQASRNLCKSEYSQKGLVSSDRNKIKDYNIQQIMVQIYDKIFP